MAIFKALWKQSPRWLKVTAILVAVLVLAAIVARNERPSTPASAPAVPAVKQYSPDITIKGCQRAEQMARDQGKSYPFSKCMQDAREAGEIEGIPAKTR